jgi:hypothetical protein
VPLDILRGTRAWKFSFCHIIAKTCRSCHGSISTIFSVLMVYVHFNPASAATRIFEASPSCWLRNARREPSSAGRCSGWKCDDSSIKISVFNSITSNGLDDITRLIESMPLLHPMRLEHNDGVFHNVESMDRFVAKLILSRIRSLKRSLVFNHQDVPQQRQQRIALINTTSNLCARNKCLKHVGLLLSRLLTPPPPPPPQQQQQQQQRPSNRSSIGATTTTNVDENMSQGNCTIRHNHYHKIAAVGASVLFSSSCKRVTALFEKEAANKKRRSLSICCFYSYLLHGKNNHPPPFVPERKIVRRRNK